MQMLRKMIILPLVLFLPSCVAISTANMEKSEKLAADEGVLLVRTYGEGMDAGQIHVHDVTGGAFQFAAVSISFKPGEQIIFLKVKGNATYSLTRYATYGGSVDFGKKKYTVTIEPGKINYIGDISIKQDGFSVRTSIQDEESTTLTKAKNRAPWLFERYPYTKSLIKIAPGDDSPGY